MGLFLCNLCNESLDSEDHACHPADIRNYIHKLKVEAGTAKRRLDEICNAVFMVLEPLSSLDGDEVAVKTTWLRNLWNAAQCQWRESKTPESFLSRWMALHRVLCEAFDLFRSSKYGKIETLLEKLTALKQACDHAKLVMGYQDSRLDLSPEEVVVDTR